MSNKKFRPLDGAELDRAVGGYGWVKPAAQAAWNGIKSMGSRWNSGATAVGNAAKPTAEAVKNVGTAYGGYEGVANGVNKGLGTDLPTPATDGIFGR